MRASMELHAPLILSIAVMSASCFNLKSFNTNHGLGKPGKDQNDVYFGKLSEPVDQWFTQKLDHFDPLSEYTWQQRYQTNASFYKHGGPIFLMVGGEGEITAKWLVKGNMMVLAKRFNAICFQLEHRFYGESRPTKDTSVENLRYLQSEQALADIAYFISSMKHRHELPATTKVIAFGGSYPGSLAAWLRLKYPHLVHGAVSSSGPLRAVVDFHDYFLVVRDALVSQHSEKCAEAVRIANEQLDSNLSRKTVGSIHYVETLFQLCDKLDVTNQLDVASLYESLSDNLADVVQYNKDNRDSPTASVTITTICDIMTNANKPELERYAKVNNLMLEIRNDSCLDYKYDKMIEKMRNISWESEANQGGRQWLYQTCTEFGFYQTSRHEDDLFGPHFPVTFFIDQCTKIFGSAMSPPRVFSKSSLTEATKRTNILYGSLKTNLDRVLYVHGSVDPWHALGITEPLVQPHLYQTIFINGTAHCANMYPPADNDSAHLKFARERIEEIVADWLLVRPIPHHFAPTDQSNEIANERWKSIMKILKLFK